MAAKVYALGLAFGLKVSLSGEAMIKNFMRIRQMGFSSRLKAHRHILTLETLKFIAEYLVDGNAKQAALRAGIPETYAARQGQWLKKHAMVKSALERDLDERDIRQLHRALHEIQQQMAICEEILGLPSQPPPE
mgnify:CR=1 FL=1